MSAKKEEKAKADVDIHRDVALRSTSLSYLSFVMPLLEFRPSGHYSSLEICLSSSQIP